MLYAMYLVYVCACDGVCVQVVMVVRFLKWGLVDRILNKGGSPEGVLHHGRAFIP